ncbi:MAG: hypothetical protein ACSLEM_02220 [Candidatus Malihini olakiniferum]
MITTEELLFALATTHFLLVSVYSAITRDSLHEVIVISLRSAESRSLASNTLYLCVWL